MESLVGNRIVSEVGNACVFRGERVSSGSEQNFDLRMKQLRAGKRVNSRVPVAVEWEEARARHTAEGWTVYISPSVCLAVVQQGFAEGQKLYLVTLVNKILPNPVLFSPALDPRHA